MCYNIEGTAFCTKKAGFVHSEMECVDQDECALGYDNCDSNAECINLDGNYRCDCNTGYSKVDSVCKDIDECSGENACEQICSNTIGSYTCKCESGYTLQSDGHTCLDDDECKTDICASNADCSNVQGSYDCECYDGFYDSNIHEHPIESKSLETSKRPHCVNINECKYTEPWCGENSQCSDSGQVNAECNCDAGYESETGANCVDIDECGRINGNGAPWWQSQERCAPENSHCINAPGSYNCECDFGYEAVAGRVF